MKLVCDCWQIGDVSLTFVLSASGSLGPRSHRIPLAWLDRLQAIVKCLESRGYTGETSIDVTVLVAFIDVQID